MHLSKKTEIFKREGVILLIIFYCLSTSAFATEKRTFRVFTDVYFLFLFRFLLCLFSISLYIVISSKILKYFSKTGGEIMNMANRKAKRRETSM